MKDYLKYALKGAGFLVLFTAFLGGSIEAIVGFSKLITWNITVAIAILGLTYAGAFGMAIFIYSGQQRKKNRRHAEKSLSDTSGRHWLDATKSK